MFSWVGVQSTIPLLKNLICSSSQEKHYIRTCTVQSERPTRGRERRAAVHNLPLQSDRDLRVRNLQRRDNTWPTRGDKRSSNAAKTPDGMLKLPWRRRTKPFARKRLPQWVLATFTVTRISPTHYLHYTIWEISFQQTTHWHLQRSWTISKENECNPWGLGRSRLPNWWCAGHRQRWGITWHKTDVSLGDWKVLE